MRLNLTLDDEQAAKLTTLAKRAHLQPGTYARSLLLTGLDRAAADDPLAPLYELERAAEEEPESVAEMAHVLLAIPGFREKLAAGLIAAAEGRTIPLEEL